MVTTFAFALIGTGILTQLIAAWIGVFHLIEQKPFGKTILFLGLGVTLYTLGLYVPVWESPTIAALRTWSASHWLFIFVIAAIFFGTAIGQGRPRENPLTVPFWAGIGLVIALCGAQAFIHWYIYA